MVKKTYISPELVIKLVHTENIIALSMQEGKVAKMQKGQTYIIGNKKVTIK